MCFVISNFSCFGEKVWKSSHIHCVIFLRYDKLQTAQDCWIVVDTVSVSYKSIIFNYLMRSSEWIWGGRGWTKGRTSYECLLRHLRMASQSHSQKNTEPENFPNHTRPFVASGPAWCDMQINLTENIFSCFLARKIVVVMYGNKWERRKLVYEHASRAMIHKYSSDSSPCTSPTCFRVASKQNAEIAEKFEIFCSPVEIPEPWCGIWRGVSLAK